MFTGIVEEMGVLTDITHLGDSAQLHVTAPLVTADAGHGDSVSVNGVCLTVTQTGDGSFSTDVMAQTLTHSSIGTLEIGSAVNLERALPSNGRLGGHIVQGHVDTTAALLSREPGERWDVLTFTLAPSIARYVVSRGSITLDGVSLTVSDVAPDQFCVSLIPTTLASTTLGRLSVGRSVNVEVDVLAKYVERLLIHREEASHE